MARDVWDILKHIETISQPIYSTVNPPATEEEINLLESTLNVQLPSHFRSYLSTWNGQQEQVPFIGYNSFLSIPDIIEIWSMMNDLFEDEERVDWIDEDRIKPLIWSKKWIPFTDFEASSRLILDLDTLKGIETTEREDLGEAVWQLSQSDHLIGQPITEEMAQHWFDAARDY